MIPEASTTPSSSLLRLSSSALSLSMELHTRAERLTDVEGFFPVWACVFASISKRAA